MKTLVINAETKQKIIEDEDGFSILSRAILKHLHKNTWKYSPLDPRNFLSLSSGPLTGYGIPGAHRVIISARSPMTQGFFFSTVGGLGEELFRTGLNNIDITGRAKVPSIILIRYRSKEDELSVKIEPFPHLYETYQKKGVYSVQDYIVKKYSEYYGNLRYRSIVAGPSGFNSVIGGLNSILVRNHELISDSQGFAGRGGFGSVLAQAHNIVAVVIGGNFQRSKTSKTGKNLAKIVSKYYEESNINKIAMQYTKKYRAKGTFLSNYESSENDTLMFNWNSIYWDKKKRSQIYHKFIKDSYISGNLDEKMSSKTCGEACPALCKKSIDGHVMDYEPYSSCGPNIGIFRTEYAMKIVEYVDNLGFDAISFGNLIGAVFNAIEEGKISADSLGLPRDPLFNADDLDIEEASKVNSNLAIHLAKKLAFEKTILDKGIRAFSKEFNLDCSVYLCFGSDGFISPNQYLRPGFIAPLPILGKFTTYYKREFLEPKELGKRSAQRLIKELYNEDTGFCRFHRGWAEKIIPKLVQAIAGFDIDYEWHIRKVLGNLIEYNRKANSLPTKWCNTKIKEIAYFHLAISSDKFGEDYSVKKWRKRFKQDFEQAADAYWEQMLEGIKGVLGNEYGKLLESVSCPEAEKTAVKKGTYTEESISF